MSVLPPAFRPPIWLATCLAVCLSVGTGALAQDSASSEPALPTRVPAEGLAVLDCAPPAPAPEDSCLVRVPSGRTLGNLSSAKLGDTDASFDIVRSGSNLPDGVVLTSTLVLIDLSTGPGNGRTRSWPRERDAIIQMVRGLPSVGEIAVFGFSDKLQVISGFGPDRQASVRAIEALEISEVNTILATNLLQAIDRLEERENAIFKNLIVVTDGDEEGIGDFDRVVADAAAAGVTLSALGTFWLPESAEATSRGKDKLKQFTELNKGLMGEVFLRNTASISQSVSAFTRQYEASIGRSGVILPEGEAAAARITVEMNVPGAAASGATRSETFIARFTPAGAQADPPEPIEPAPPEEKTIIAGVPDLYTYIGGAVLGLFLLILLLVLLRPKSEAEPGEQGEDTDPDSVPDILPGAPIGSDPTTVEPAPAPVPAPVPLPPVSAYLVRVDTGKRLALRGDRAAVGRLSTNDLVVEGDGVSREHAVLFRNGNGGFSISDIGSTNGTFVNDKKITGTEELRIGDAIGLGKSVKVRLTLP